MADAKCAACAEKDAKIRALEARVTHLEGTIATVRSAVGDIKMMPSSVLWPAQRPKSKTQLRVVPKHKP